MAKREQFRPIASTVIRVTCLKTVLSRKRWRDGLEKVTRTTYPVFEEAVFFDRPDEERKDKTFLCPFCSGFVEYRAYCKLIPKFIMKPKKFAVMLVAFLAMLLVLPILTALGFEYVGEEVHLLGSYWIELAIALMFLFGALGLIIDLAWFTIDRRKARSRSEDKYVYRLKVKGGHRKHQGKDSWTHEELRARGRKMPMEAKWYFSENNSKHVRQIVLRIPPEAEVPSRIEGCLLHGAALLTQNWAAKTLFMRGDTPDRRGPFIFAKANGVVELLKSRPARVAFAFYRFRAGGVLQIFVNVSSPEVEARGSYPFIVENGHWPDNEDSRQLIPALLDRENLDVCFVADGPVGPCQGYFGLRVVIPEDCRDALKREWESLNQYHSQIPSFARNFGAAMRQFESENPLEENPVLDETCAR